MTDQLNRNVKIFKVDMTDYARQKKQRDQIQDSFYDLSLTDLGFEQRCKTAEANKMRTFRTTTMREADIPKIGNEFTTIRIRFPDDFILQGDFQAKEKLAAVREFIREQIAYPDGDFELLMVGSGGKLSDPSKTLKAYKLCPNILLIFKYTDVTENELKSAHLPKRYLKDVPMPVINHKNVLPQGFYRKDVPKPGFNYSWRSVPAVRKRGKRRSYSTRKMDNTLFDGTLQMKANLGEMTATAFNGTIGAQLNRDLLMKIAEKVMFAKAVDVPENLDSVDLTIFSKLSLMFASRLARNAMMMQFRRLSVLFFHGDGLLQLRDPVILKEKDEQQVNKRFKISRWMTIWLLAIDIFRLKIVQLVGIRLFKCVLQDESPAESLAKILLHDSPIGQNRAARWDFSDVQMGLNNVFVSSSHFIGSFDILLNLNAQDLAIIFQGTQADFAFQPSESRITAYRTEEFRLRYISYSADPMTDLKNLPSERLRALIRYVLSCCPGLRMLDIGLAAMTSYSEADFEPYAEWVLETNRELGSETLADNGAEECHMTLDHVAFFPTTTLTEAVESGHEISKQDEQMHGPGNPVIQRRVKLSERFLSDIILIGVNEGGGEGMEDDERSTNGQRSG